MADQGGRTESGGVQGRADDLNEEHLKWLVQSRSTNQDVTLKLYSVIKNNAASIEVNIGFAQLAQELAAVAFSLWRAVFLSDLTEDVENQMIDVQRFLGTLISHNAIAYQQDRASREWTFQYYLNNARERLLAMARQASLAIVTLEEINIEARSAKEDWSIAQRALSNAVDRFAESTKHYGISHETS
jgi:hypothetical protein